MIFFDFFSFAGMCTLQIKNAPVFNLKVGFLQQNGSSWYFLVVKIKN